MIVNTSCEDSEPTKLHIICKFTDELLHIVSKLKETPTCMVEDFNEDISMTGKRHCCSMLTLKGFKQIVKKTYNR